MIVGHCQNHADNILSDGVTENNSVAIQHIASSKSGIKIDL
ncbi:MAG: hypothetical protein ACJA13_003004 [Paraglaciecola sp.]|jgi:hypothetical protein